MQKARKEPPALLARIKGSIAYICPNCKKLSIWKAVNWRKARRECAECHRKFEFGINFFTKLEKLPPFNGRYAEKQTGQPYNNLIDGHPGVEWMCEITGVIDFFCPACLERQQRAPTQPECWIRCTRCRAMWHVGLIMWKPRIGQMVQMPDDWSMPGVTYEDTRWPATPLPALRAHRLRVGGSQPPTAPDSPPPAEPGEGTGEPR